MPIFFDTRQFRICQQQAVQGFQGTATPRRRPRRRAQATLKKILDKTAGFTTTKVANAKGYTIRMEISKLDVGGGNTKCSLSGSITRYPKGVTMKGAKGDEMVSLRAGRKRRGHRHVRGLAARLRRSGGREHDDEERHLHHEQRLSEAVKGRTCRSIWQLTRLPDPRARPRARPRRAPSDRSRACPAYPAGCGRTDSGMAPCR